MKNVGISFLALALVAAAAAGTPAAAQSLTALTAPQEGRTMRATSGNTENNDDYLVFTKGETKTLAVLEGPGKITHFWFAPLSADIRFPRALVLRVYWDGAASPSVEVPFGDFFGAGNGMQAEVNSLPVKVSSFGRGYNCYWEMPFRKQARITVSNESDRAGAELYFQVDWTKYDQPAPVTMYFHARYHQEYPAEMGRPYTVFNGRGRGHYVGTVLSSQNGIGHWFGEGDDYFYIDGETTPSVLGTGTEDYINEAWNMRVHTGLYTGCTIFEPRAPDARVTAYRWHIQDPVNFRKSLKFTIERRGFIMNAKGEVVAESGSRPDNWSSVSFWYQDSVAEPWCAFPPYRERVNPEIVLHLPEVMAAIKHSDGVELQLLPYSRATWTKPWFRARNEAVGSWIEIPFEIKEAGRYSMSLFQTLRTDQGLWQVFVDGQELAVAGESHIPGGYDVDLVRQLAPGAVNTVLDFYNIYRKNEHEDIVYGQRHEAKIGLFEFKPGAHALRLVCVGANPLAVDPLTRKPGYNLAADVLSLRRIPFENMDSWVEKMLQMEKRK
ncbi:MAG TPA: DUF2961 domain-containing protein [Candidatus Aminicenantes bacterium]|nr:DUF2961 domain-containing protein [Candidatus Aminicenantes bacterium]HRY65705.1 DUF2961 domain-containing protein [Candidatus Aminicenantes bacterium]HRZ72619.1 DUF2961 domain-containing protein [Candidatus Aminicenantes bacterium]